MTGRDWRDEIRTPAQKHAYIQNVLGLSGGRANKEYTNAYNRLSDYAAGRIESPGPKYRAVETTARATVEGKAVPMAGAYSRGEGHAPARPTAPAHTLYRVGDTITGTVRFRMDAEKGNPNGTRTREISGTWEITTESAARLAAHGRGSQAILKEYFRGQDGQTAGLNQYTGGGGRDFTTSGGNYGSGGYGGGGGGGRGESDYGSDYGDDDAGYAEGRDYAGEGQDLDEWEADYGDYDDYDWRDDWGDDAEDYAEVA